MLPSGRIAVAALAGVLLATTANATHYCTAPPLVDAGGLAYVVYDNWPDCVLSCYYFSAWVYAESNGEPGLQRGGVTLLGDADVCQSHENPDMGVF